MPEESAMTPEQAAEQQIEKWRRLSLEGRFRMVIAMIEDGFALVDASIRAAHPEYTPEEFRAALRERIYGDEIAGKLESWEAGRLKTPSVSKHPSLPAP